MLIPADPSRRRVLAWAIYDWANSAYVLTTATAVLPAYFAAAVVPAGGLPFLNTHLAASTLWGLMVGGAALLVFLLAPVLGAVADFTGRSGSFLKLFCLTGAAAGFGLSFIGPGDALACALLFIVAQTGFAGGNVFYDSFLPRIAPPGEADKVSALGYAWGYAGGGLQFVLSLVLITFADKLGLTSGQAARGAMGFAALWWAGFALIPFAALRDVPPSETMPPELARLPRPLALVRLGFSRSAGAIRALCENAGVGRFLLAYLFFNDGVQTVIAMATIYGQEELKLPMAVLMGALVLIQAVAVVGSLIFSRLAGRIGTRRALLTTLAIWAGITAYAWIIDSATEYVALGALVGLVLGGSQSLARSYYSVMVPPERSAQYFGYFSVLTKLSAVGGPLLFAAVRQGTGSARGAVLGIMAFFAVGAWLLWGVKEPSRQRPGQERARG